MILLAFQRMNFYHEFVFYNSMEPFSPTLSLFSLYFCTEFENCDSLPRNISNISNYTKEAREKIIIPSSGHNEQPTLANNEISVPGRKARNAKFTQKLRQRFLHFFLIIMII